MGVLPVAARPSAGTWVCMNSNGVAIEIVSSYKTKNDKETPAYFLCVDSPLTVRTSLCGKQSPEMKKDNTDLDVITRSPNHFPRTSQQ
jgi:hypothetical protein